MTNKNVSLKIKEIFRKNNKKELQRHKDLIDKMKYKKYSNYSREDKERGTAEQQKQNEKTSRKQII
jgi:activator of HSP90 ATPase